MYPVSNVPLSFSLLISSSPPNVRDTLTSRSKYIHASVVNNQPCRPAGALFLLDPSQIFADGIQQTTSAKLAGDSVFR